MDHNLWTLIYGPFNSEKRQIVWWNGLGIMVSVSLSKIFDSVGQIKVKLRLII